MLLCVTSCAAPSPPVTAPADLGAHALAHCHARGDLPDPECTPGATEDLTVEQICSQSTKERRNVPESEKRSVLESYGMSREADGDLEIDHLIPLALAGRNTVDNLWPEVAPAYHRKDVVELKAHNAVCAGTLDLQEAQRAIARDWRALERRLGK